MALPPFPIIDAHHHLWNPQQNYHPWLSDATPIAFRYGDYAALRRPYLEPDFLNDASGFALAGSVYVETEWDPKDPIGETRYVASLRALGRLPSVAVAQAWLDAPDAAAVLEAQAGFDFVRSVRHKPRANPSAQDAAPGGMSDARWRAGFARLQPLGLRFDLQTPWWHLAEAARLAADFPSTQIILNHTGLPADRSPEALAAWLAKLRTLAGCPNVALKISGIGIKGRPWTVEAQREVVLRAIDTFGVERSMFASNFPVDGLCGSYTEIMGGFYTIVADFSMDERKAMFCENARRIYAINGLA